MGKKILISFIIVLIILGGIVSYLFITQNKCGNGICESNENLENCYKDCHCGDKICDLNINETANCLEDCPPYILHEWGVLLENSIRTTPLISYAVVMKPIIYLYSNNDFPLSLSVDFENGEAIEVWPNIPTSKKISWDNFEVSSDCETTPFPEDIGEMKEISELGSYVVDNANCITHENTTSKILFYNGKIDFGNIITKYYIDLGDKKQITLTNNLEQDISDVYINYKKPLEFYNFEVYGIENITLGTLKIGRLKAGETKTFEMSVNTYDSSELPIVWQNQAKEFKQRLINIGLYTDEVNKFMIAWEDTFFGIQPEFTSNLDYRNGMNIIFILPEEKYDELFKLETSIEPQEIKRVGVVFSPIEESVPVGTTTSSSASSSVEIEENCGSYTNQIKVYCNPFSSTYNKVLCSEAEKNYEEDDCCQSGF